MNNHDDDMDGVFAQLGGVRLRGPGHRHQRDEIKARLFGEEPPLRRVGRFILLGDLGHGGMGTVWRAYDEQLDRQVAIKLMRESLRAEHEARLLREAQALARLSHPNVVQVYEVGSVDDQLFIAMELLAGDTLRDWQDRQDQPWRASLDAYVQAGRGLAAAHSADLIHRDFKPSNCMIDPDGRVRVLDFGLACGVDLDHELDASVELTASGEYPASKSGSGSIPSSSSSMLRRRLTQASSLLGTKAYMAPEQLYGMPPSVHSDQFSFCVALYEALYRQLPFSEQPVATLLEMAEGTAHMPQPPTTGSDVPRWLQRAVWRGVSANVQDRWPSMEALLHELEHQLPRPRRRGMMAAGATAAVLGLVGVASMPSSSATLPPCHDAADRLGDPWGPAERQSVRDAIIETDLPYAPQAWSTVERQLEDYTEGLGAAYVHACEATYVRHDQTRADLGLRHTCLDERRDGLVDTIELLGTVEAREVSNVVAAIARAPRIEDCSEPEALARATAGSGSEAARELRRELERVRALRYIGRHERALDQLAPILARAEHLGDRGLVAEAVYLDGELRVDTGADDIANERFTAARALALTHARDE
ncbi:MAG: serine/threonine protein kinase, partial [Deltaproteobacteria bacterium]|nr:serine/threonine protein kinase [Deltaproteobacteria bacterium]